MPAKKKRPEKKTPKKAPARTLREQLALAKQINDDQYTTSLELGEQLRRTERAYDAEVAFWKKEVEHLQQLVVDARISGAVKK